MLNNPYYNPYFEDTCEDLREYEDLYHALRSGRDLRPLYMWTYWPELCKQVEDALIPLQDFVTAMEKQEAYLESDLESEL